MSSANDRTSFAKTEFLPGCGIEYVHWIPSRPARSREPDPICDTPILAAKAVKSARIRKALIRGGIESWKMLASASRSDFHGWKNYGEKSHARLVEIAYANGWTIQTWR